MKLKIALLAATAVGMTMGTAWAGSSNTLFIDQQGSGNSADVQQAAGTGGNDIGTTASPFLQKGDNNKFAEIQATGGGFSRGDNDIVKGKQVGNGNNFSDYYSNNAGGNRVNNFTQDGNSNTAAFTRNASINGVIGTVTQDGSSNFLSISQASGTNNEVTKVRMIGSNNGWSMVNPGNQGTRIGQSGSYNVIMESTVEGSNNNSAYGNRNVNFISQSGNSNGRTASTARTLGSNGNGISVTETGDWNNFDVRQGVSTGSTGNYATVTQMGSYNSANATQYGDGNNLTVNQIGNGNTSSTLFTGNDNGVGTLTGAAGVLDASSSSLTQGIVLQDSSPSFNGNMLDYNVHGSNNLFAFAQIGGNNTINGKVGTGGVDSDGNQAAVLQNGSYNTTSFTQIGAGGNNLAVSQ